ncbi:tyrosine-type recombinase/integrase [Desulfocurvibacter africanus]|uniref:tyrosine-type recombinase/integrase n=1 Tax=Desulfocurvibacter africanus TaxID=873 RepID=UPI000425DF02|nr:site-specific integrase [Desulfocurvibacter africanus]
MSAFTANKDIRYLRSTFNLGKKKRWILENPVDGIDFLPVEKRLKYVPGPAEIEKVLAVTDPETRDYLTVIRETLARVSEVNRLTWEDVNLEGRYVVLYTRKKRGGHLTPRKVPMTDSLHAVLARRFKSRDPEKPWVFWHEYLSSKTGETVTGPYQDRKKFMRTLCKKAGVPYFRFHALRHSGASVLDQANVPIGSIQRILGHENRTTTEIYLHSLGDSEREAMRVV